MLLSVDVTEKSFGDKTLYEQLSFDIQDGEKVGLIGRNGTGKSTLFNMITGEDTDYQGEITIRKNMTIIASRQEHHGFQEHTVLDYIQSDLPEFAKLKHIIDTYPEHMDESQHKLQRYSDALERFSQLGYYEVEDSLNELFDAYQLDRDLIERKIGSLSGGQKRMIELVKVQRARGHLALIDEPTNHMDYVAKAAFIKWLKAAQEAVLVITHDRDVLATVDKIIEVRDGRCYTFRGNYQHYLEINKNNVTSQVNEYDLTQRRIKNLQADVIRFRRMKEKARDPGTIKRFKSQEEKAVNELKRLEQTEKPSFWIDRESAGDLTPKMSAAYQSHKARNIRLRTKSEQSKSSRLLVEAHELQLGYGETPLFAPISFALNEGTRVRLHGRNGAGKTTLVNAILAKNQAVASDAQTLGGTLAIEKELLIGLYEQEIAETYLSMTLYDAIEHSLSDKNLPVSDQHTRQLMGEYLFTPNDATTLVAQLSGGQKARLQLIRMLLGNPLLLILDEPTNHLDLPSIEELEDALSRYRGAVLYISHDSLFANKLGGETVNLSNR